MGIFHNRNTANNESKGNILIVDDNSGNLRVLDEMLTKQEYEVRPATSGALALRSIQYFLPDIILLDIKMPDMSGYEVCEILRKNEQTRDIPVIFISAMGETPDKIRAFEAGGMDYITKPFQPEEILARVKTHLELTATRKKLKRLNEELEERVLEKTAELKKSEKQYRLLSENIADVIWTMDNNFHITYISPSIKQLRGYSPEEVMKTPLEEKFVPQSLKKAEKILQIEKFNKPVAHEFQQPCKDGSTVWTEMKVKALYDETGNRIGIIGCSRDITDRKQAELEKETLEKRLRQAHKMEAIGTLAGGIAHDFNNILSIIFGYYDLAMLDLKSSEKLETYLHEIRKGAGRAKDLVNQILTFSRMTEKEKHPLHPSLIVKEVLKLLRPSIPTTIEIVESIHSEKTLLADSTQIHQIIMNLCTNAYQAMRETGGTLTVSLQDIVHNEEDNTPDLNIPPGKYIQLEVSDTGHGMDEETKAKIFEPYFTTKEIEEGTGLGLAVVHGIVKSHNGHIFFNSEPGKGTTCHVYFPVFGGTSMALERTSKEPVTGGNERIMFVDDEEKICHIANEVLTKYGYHVSVFKNGIQAAHEFENQPIQYDLVITDTTMPQMNGVELAHRIFKSAPHVPVILCSGHSDLIDREELKSLGIHFVQKPIIMSELVMEVRKALDKVQI